MASLKQVLSAIKSHSITTYSKYKKQTGRARSSYDLFLHVCGL